MSVGMFYSFCELYGAMQPSYFELWTNDGEIVDLSGDTEFYCLPVHGLTIDVDANYFEGGADAHVVYASLDISFGDIERMKRML